MLYGHFFQVINFDHLFTERFYPIWCVFLASIYFNTTRFSKFIPIISKTCNLCMQNYFLFTVDFVNFLSVLNFDCLRFIIISESDNDPLKVSSTCISLILDNPSSVFSGIINAKLYCQSNFLTNNYISHI